MSRDIHTIIEQTTHEHWGRLFSILVGQFRDFELAEECLQEALISALSHWQNKGVPENREAWLMRTAKNKAIDILRRNQNLEEKIESLAFDSPPPIETPMNAVIPDERLKLIFTCCHPALDEHIQVALTLRSLIGLTTTEIARAFLLPDTTMAQRLVRAKRKIKAANIPYKVPDLDEWPARLSAVLKVIYFIFNEGHTASNGHTLLKTDLCEEAIFLGEMLGYLLPSEPEVIGLNALMHLHLSRTKARTGDDGSYTSLECQNRKLWDQEQIALGDRLLKTALSYQKLGPYQVQAAISGVHAHADSFAKTDWQEIVMLYKLLYRFEPTPVVRLNGLVALSYLSGPENAYPHLIELNQDKTLEHYQPFHAVKADFLKRLGKLSDAINAYECAIKLSNNHIEREFLEKRLEHVKEDLSKEKRELK